MEATIRRAGRVRECSIEAAARRGRSFCAITFSIPAYFKARYECPAQQLVRSNGLRPHHLQAGVTSQATSLISSSDSRHPAKV